MGRTRTPLRCPRAQRSAKHSQRPSFPPSKPVPRTPFLQDGLLEEPGIYGSGKAVWPLPQRLEETAGSPAPAGLKWDYSVHTGHVPE